MFHKMFHKNAICKTIYGKISKITYKKTTCKKAQSWYTDFAFGVMIALLGIGLFFYLVYNIPIKNQKIDSNLLQDAAIISDSLLSPGYPPDWNSSNLVRIGIVYDVDEGNKINLTKLNDFYNLDYDLTKRLFGIYNNYYIELCYRNGTIIEINNASYFGRKNSLAKNLVKLTRVVFFRDDFVKMNVYVWTDEK